MTILVAQADQQAAVIPTWVVDLESFRRWATSDDFPQSGCYSHLDGDLWIDMSMERVFHNQIKGKIGVVLSTLIDGRGSGDYFFDRMLLTHVEAGISTEPDGMFVAHESWADTRAMLQKGPDSLEVVGTPDMVLEVVSRTSRQKDRVVLPKLYHRAKVREYWIAEAFADRVELEILVWQDEGFAASANLDGWTKSPVFGKGFRMTMSSDRAGIPAYRLEVQD